MRILATGASSQDFAWLAKFLLEQGCEVFGTIRRSSSYNNLWRLSDIGIADRITLIPADMTDQASLFKAIKEAKPEIIFNLAAQSFVQASFYMPKVTMDIDGLGVLSLLEVVLEIDPSIRVYQANSSEMFGNSDRESNNEDSPFNPASPYGMAKVYAHHAVKVYREAYGMFVVGGILHNHCSKYRGLEFLSRKVTNHVARIATKQTTEKLKLGNIESIRDWGFAPDMIEAMWLMVQQDKPKDYVAATGVGHSVKQFAEAAYGMIGENWEDHVVISERYKRPLDVWKLVGDPTRIKNDLGWQHKTDFHGLVEHMVEADIDRWTSYSRGENFPWDIIPTR